MDWIDIYPTVSLIGLATLMTLIAFLTGCCIYEIIEIHASERKLDLFARARVTPTVTCEVKTREVTHGIGSIRNDVPLACEWKEKNRR
jgi:hypothetical protein